MLRPHVLEIEVRRAQLGDREVLDHDPPGATHIGSQPDMHVGTHLDDVAGQIGERVQGRAVALDADLVDAIPEVRDTIRAVLPGENVQISPRAAGQLVIATGAEDLIPAAVSEQFIAGPRRPG